MKLSEISVPVYGDISFRGDCPIEDVEQISFLNWLRHEYPLIGSIAVHVKNEGQVMKGQFSKMSKHRAMGMVAGASDIIIPGAPSFTCELKRKNHMKSKLSPEQHRYLVNSMDAGSFACVALGADGARLAFLAYLKFVIDKKG